MDLQVGLKLMTLTQQENNLQEWELTTASLAVGGSTGTAVESWNGSSWSEVAEVNTSRRSSSWEFRHFDTDGLVFGGYKTNPACCKHRSLERFNMDRSKLI